MERKLTRRSLILGGAALAVGVPAATSVVTREVEGALKRSHFQPHRGSSFELSGAHGRTTLRLHDVEDLPGAASGHLDAFSLIFRPTGGTAAPQDLYTMTHGELGAFALFLVPIGLEDDYQAVFNNAVG